MFYMPPCRGYYIFTFSMTTGYLINIEGPSGSGKSTIGQALQEILLYRHELKVKHFDDWLGATSVGQHIKSFIASDKNFDLDSLSYTLMLDAAKLQFIREVAYPLTQDGTHVITECLYDTLFVNMGSLGTLEDYLNEAANMRHNSGLYERPDITVITTMIGMAEDRLGEANDKSFPDPLEGFGWDIRRQAVQAWEERIGAVKRDLQNTPDKALVVYPTRDSVITDGRWRLDAIADAVKNRAIANLKQE